MMNQITLKLSRMILIGLLSIRLCTADEDTGLANMAGSTAIDFRNDVVPVLTKLGCNSGACHGSAAGRGEFRLSLYGSRPSADYDSITRQFQGRRINLVNPDRSLLLQKPGGELDHEGGYLFGENEQAAFILRTWIQQAAPRNAATSRQLLSLETDSQPLKFATPTAEHQLRFRAHYDDGTSSDVTQWVVVTTPDETAVSVDSQTNFLQIKRPGRHVLIARYLDQVVPIEIIVPFAKAGLKIEWQQNLNLVDDQVYQRMNQLGISAAASADDSTFLRRIFLAVTGKLPTPSQTQSFLRDVSTTKRQSLIESLLESKEFVDYWTFQLAQQLRLRTQPANRVGARTYHAWLHEQLQQEAGWDQMVRRMLLASGDSHLIGEANFHRTANGAREQTEFVSEALMGITLRCANCHDHPFDRWTQDDYHGLAAIFAKTKQGRIVESNPLGINTHPVTGQAATQQLPGQPQLNASRSGIQAYADWLLAKGNPYFAKAMVNRLWKVLMGRGLVEPVDDLRLSNPATHPELLNQLAADFVAHRYDLRHTISLICRSEAFQRGRAIDPEGTQPQQPQSLFYGCRLVQRLPAEVLADAICDVTGIPEVYANVLAGTRAIQLFDPKTPSVALDVLGRCSREEACESPDAGSQVGLASQLHFINGKLLNQKISSEFGRLSKLIDSGSTDSEIVEQFFLLSYCRPASKAEAFFWQQHLSDVKPGSETSRRQRLEDFVWSLLSSKEFYSNH